MALHNQLPIYRAAYGLLDDVTTLVKNMPRDFKRSIGEKISAECIEIMVLVFRANVASDKAPHLVELLERLQVIELLLRLSMDKRLIARDGYAAAVEKTTSIGKQANGWKNAANRRPLR
ncbi:four helix bundle protein [Burkholderia cenocepacia]|uniref:four helix bundle protein n=1 Tax=Burkholderia cenocepacia TaxID=95486 RepID=UPI001BAB8369|nr:four helix bundle protein [Burkholderia cenocepacia]QUN56092.1 four helix bundle protein [Burkholderia cenocepacia]